MSTASSTTPSAVSPGRWFCLRTAARREHVAASNLRERVQVEVFAPRIQVKRTTRSGLVATFAEALFPGYLFARFRYPEQLRHVVSTSGINGIVSFGSHPPPVADDVIDFLRQQVTAAETSPAGAAFEEGALVRIIAGCFHNAEGRVLHFDPRTDRVRLLLTLLGREIQVSLSTQQLVAADNSRGHYPSGLLAADQAATPPAA